MEAFEVLVVMTVIQREVLLFAAAIIYTIEVDLHTKSLQDTKRVTD